MSVSSNDGPVGRLAARPRRSDWRALSSSKISIERVSLPLSGNDRAAWRVTALTLCLAGCRGQSASVEQLHVLTWALRDEENSKRLRAVWDSDPGAPSGLRAWDNSLDDTLRLARASGLIAAQPSGRRKLTDLGKSLVTAVRRSGDGLMEREQRFLASLGAISEAAMWRRLGNSPRVPRQSDGRS